MEVKAYLEVSAMLESQWTGIPTVVAALASYAMQETAIDWRFVYETIELPRPLVRQMLADRTGTEARRALNDRAWEHVAVPYSEAAACKAIFTNIKPMRGLFGREAMIVYDLSPLLTPQFHEADTINHFGNRFRSDVETSVHFFPISVASREDLEIYFGVPRSASTIIPMGIDIDLGHLSVAQDVARMQRVEPYVAVLGTLEPRKNGRLVLEYLARNPGFAHRNKLVFIGRDGWMDEREKLLKRAEAAGVGRDRIVFTGYVSELEKVVLLYNSSFCVYASFFEGYGLPILEAAALGKVIACSNTSSMPEVAPEQCVFFDPGNVFDFSRAVSIAEKRAQQLRVPLSLTEVETRIARHGWEPCYSAIRDWILS